MAAPPAAPNKASADYKSAPPLRFEMVRLSGTVQAMDMTSDFVFPQMSETMMSMLSIHGWLKANYVDSEKGCNRSSEVCTEAPARNPAELELP